MASASPNKVIGERLKYYFSSLTARRASFLYTGLFDKPYKFVLANLEPDKIVKFCDATLGVHLVKVHNEQDWKYIKKLLTTLNVPINIPYVIKVSSVISALNKVKFDFDKLVIEQDADGIVSIETPKGKQALAWPMVIFQCGQILYSLYEKFIDIDINDPKYICQSIDCAKVKDGMIGARFTSTDYTNDSGEAAFPKEVDQDFGFYLADGIDVVATKEFLKKHPGPFECKVVTWARESCVEYVSYFADANVKVVSMRPHTRIYIQPKGRKRSK